jgi:hypothetical protein
MGFLQLTPPRLMYLGTTPTRISTSSATTVIAKVKVSTGCQPPAVTRDVSGGTGGGIYAEELAIVKMNHTSIEGNTAVLGGGLFCDGCKVTLGAGFVLQKNTAQFGGGAFFSKHPKTGSKMKGIWVSLNEAQVPPPPLACAHHHSFLPWNSLFQPPGCAGWGGALLGRDDPQQGHVLLYRPHRQGQMLGPE